MNKRQAKKFYKKPEAIPYLKYKYAKTILAAYNIYKYYFNPERRYFRGGRGPHISIIKQKVHGFISYMHTAIRLKRKYKHILLANYFVMANRYIIMAMERIYWTLMHGYESYYNGVDPFPELSKKYTPSLAIQRYIVDEFDLPIKKKTSPIIGDYNL